MIRPQISIKNKAHCAEHSRRRGWRKIPLSRGLRKIAQPTDGQSLTWKEGEPMELTIENLRTLAQGGQIFLTAHSQARLYERGILLADIRQAIQSGKIIEYRPDDYRCPSCLVLGVNLAGRWLHVVCGIHEGALWILTAYWPDLDHWNATYTERKKKGE